MIIVSTILARVAFCTCGSSAMTGSASGTVEERRRQTWRNIVVRFDGNALSVL